MSDEIKKDEDRSKKTVSLDKLKKDYEEIKAEEEAQADTTVTSIAHEESKTGQKLEMTEDQFMQKAYQDYIVGMQILRQGWPKLSQRAMRRCITAILQLPEENMKSALKSKDEKILFGWGQRVIQARFTIIYKHIMDKMKALKQTEKDKETAAKSKKKAKKAETKDKVTKEKENVKSEQSEQPESK